MAAPPPLMVALEVCANGLTSACHAQEAGVHRMELCEHLEVGGLTPHPELLAHVKEKVTLPVQVLVRPRAGDFCYTADEFKLMVHQVETCLALHADGIVVGLLTAEGKVDTKRCRQLVEMVKPKPVTFHRAFDVVQQPFDALEEIIDLGFHRILTSGQAVDCLQGAAVIVQLVQQAKGRITIMAGGSITVHNFAAIIRRTGAPAFHFSAKTFLTDGSIVSGLENICALKRIAEEVSGMRE